MKAAKPAGTTSADVVLNILSRCCESAPELSVGTSVELRLLHPPEAE